MKGIIIIVAICLSFLRVNSQNIDKSTDPRFGKIPAELESKIKERVEREILWYRAALCPEVDFEKFVKRGFENDIILYERDPKAIFLEDSLPKGKSYDEYKMILEVVRWPEGDPKLNSYLVKKKGLRFTNGVDTLSFDICNEYFDYDENYLVYCKDNGYPQMISGNVFQDISYPFMYRYTNVRYIEALDLAYYKMAQFKGMNPVSFPVRNYETEDYFQFKVDKSLLSPKSVIVRVPKSDPYSILEVFYYTNDTAITKGDIYGLYEVKYTLHAKPENYVQTRPVITKISRSLLNDKVKNEDKRWTDVVHFIDLPPSIEEREIQIKGKIDTVYFKKEEPFIVVVDDKGVETELINEEAVRYIIKGKGKRHVVVKEDGEIIYKED